MWRAAEKTSRRSRLEVGLIHRPRYDDWSLPKGKLLPGESEIDGALREVLEETGFRVKLGRPLGAIRYMKESGNGVRPKVVRYWAMEADAGAFIPTREVDELRWLSPGDAQNMLTHERDHEVLERFVRGPAVTNCVLLVRHALAGKRSEWSEDDRLRPLDPTGWQQAEQLVRLLARFEIDRLVSADYLRCIQTVDPLSRAIGIEVEEEKLFSEECYPGNEDEAVSIVRAMGASDHVVAVSSQGDVIPDLLERLAQEDDVQLPEPLPNKKGSVLALIFDGGQLFSVEYFPPPRLEDWND